MMVLAQNKGSAVRDPVRKMRAGSYVRRKGPVTARDLSVTLGVGEGSALSTLRHLAADGLVAETGGAWRWTGGSLLLLWEDLNGRRRAIVAHLARAGRECAAPEIAETAGIMREDVVPALTALEEAGWATRRSGKHEGTRATFGALTPAGLAAFEVATGEISTERRAAG